MKKTFLLTSLTFLLATACTAAFASPASDNLQKQLQGLKTLTADFKQEVVAQDGSILQTSTGSLAIKKPGMFRWHVKQPVPQLIVTNSSKVWIYDPGLEQVTVRRLSNSLSQTPILLLTQKTVDISRTFNVKQSENTFTLVPKNSNQDFKSIVLHFAHHRIVAMQLASTLGQSTELFFLHVMLNPALPNKLFVFLPPKGVDVVNESTS